MKKILTLLIALAVLSASCSKKTEGTPAESTLRINLEGTTKAIGTPTLAEENVINSFTAYVFENNRLERAQTFNGVITGEVIGLTAGLKHVVVVANAPASFPAFTIGDLYSKFSEPGSYISLDDQQNLNNGLMMSGEAQTTLLGLPETNVVNIPINRIAAKIMLGTVTVAADPDFVLTNVYITRARGRSSAGVPSVVTTAPYYGGLPGTVVTLPNIRQYLISTITITDFANAYFYVFANDNSDQTATILGLAGTYLGVPTYFPFVINATITGTGTYIMRNTQHTLNLTINRPASGSPDPELPSDPATLTVNVTAQDWTVLPTQNLAW